MIPKDEADNPEVEYFTLDQQVIQMDTIVKSAKFNDVNFEYSGATEKVANAATDNANVLTFLRPHLARLDCGFTQNRLSATASSTNG